MNNVKAFYYHKGRNERYSVYELSNEEYILVHKHLNAWRDIRVSKFRLTGNQLSAILRCVQSVSTPGKLLIFSKFKLVDAQDHEKRRKQGE